MKFCIPDVVCISDTRVSGLQCKMEDYAVHEYVEQVRTLNTSWWCVGFRGPSGNALAVSERHSRFYFDLSLQVGQMYAVEVEC